LPTTLRAASSTESTEAGFGEPKVNLKDVDDRCKGEEEERKEDEIQMMMMMMGNSGSLPGQFCNVRVRHSL